MANTNPGDLVRLKSGSPKMTVEKVVPPKEGDGKAAPEVVCCYFAKKKLVS